MSSFFRVETIPIRPLGQMVWIDPGEFVMGSPPDEEGRFLDKEEPQTRVTLTRGYWMSKYEVTQAEFEAVLGLTSAIRTIQSASVLTGSAQISTQKHTDCRSSAISCMSRPVTMAWRSIN